MLKSDLLPLIHKKNNYLNINDVESITNLFFKKIILSLKNKQKIEIRGFGILSKKNNKAKFVRNPKTNEKIYKEESFKIHFKIGKILHKKINSEYKRCASVVDAVVQMISYNEPVDCIPNVSNIKQEGPGRPKGKKKKAKWTKEVTQAAKKRREQLKKEIGD